MPRENCREQAKRKSSPGATITLRVLFKQKTKQKQVQEFYLQPMQPGIVIKNSFGQFLQLVVTQVPTNK